MVAQNVTQTSKFSCPLVVQAELKRLGSCHRIQGFQPGIISQHVQNGSVGLPQKLEPRRHQLPISPILQSWEA